MYVLIAILVVLWLLGLMGNIGGGFIHLLLIAALVMFLVNFFTGRRGVV